MNYHHLHHFWVVAREGGLAPAARALRLAPPTLSGQIHALELAMGEKLFVRRGRRLVLTESGAVAQGYADQIFGLGRELLDTLKGRAPSGSLRLAVGIVDAVPRSFVSQLLSPVLDSSLGAGLVVQVGLLEHHLERLGAHALDVVIADAPVPQGSTVRAFNHEVADCGVSFLAAPVLAGRLRGKFPACLDGAPMLLPPEGTTLRRSLERWLAHVGVTVRVVGDIGDTALAKVLCAEGVGVYAAPTLIEEAAREQHQLRVLARTDVVRERFYLLTGERRIRHPLALRIMEGRPWARSS